MQVWLSYASFEATPASMLGEEEQEEADSEADRRQAAAAQEGPAAAADREAHARRSACLPCTQNVTPTFALKLSCLMHHKWLHISDCQGLQLQYSYLHPPPIPRPSPPLCVKVSFGPCTVLSLPHGPVCRHLQLLSASASVSCLVCKQRRGSDTLSCKCG